MQVHQDYHHLPARAVGIISRISAEEYLIRMTSNDDLMNYLMKIEEKRTDAESRREQSRRERNFAGVTAGGSRHPLEQALSHSTKAGGQ